MLLYRFNEIRDHIRDCEGIPAADYTLYPDMVPSLLAEAKELLAEVEELRRHLHPRASECHDVDEFYRDYPQPNEKGSDEC